MIDTVRVQEKGQVTIPQAIRRKLKLRKGDLVTFIATENGVVIKTLKAAADEYLATLSALLFKRNQSLDELLNRAQQAGPEILASEFNLTVEEKTLLFEALQLKAITAVEEIRSMSQNLRISEEEIDYEINEMRHESDDSHRT